MRKLSRSNLYYWLAGGALTCLAAFCLYSYCAVSPPAAADLPPLVRITEISTVEAAQNYAYSGEVRGRYESQLAFPVNSAIPYNGKIIRRNVDVGSVVNPGDVLMVMDSQDLQQTADIYSAQVASAESQLTLAQTNLGRYRQLFSQGAVSRSALDQYQSAYDVALANVRQSQAQYSQSSYQVAASVIYADAPGVIADISAEVGQVVSAGQPVITLVRDGQREIEIDVPENRLTDLQAASQLKVTFWALPGIVAQGKLRELSPIADPVTRTYKARVSLINPPPQIKLGMTATVTVIGPVGQQPAIYIPLSAIYQTQNTPAVWVVNGGTVHLCTIKLGAFGDDNTIQVLTGLSDGEVIVTAGVHKLLDGQKVRTAGGDSL